MLASWWPVAPSDCRERNGRAPICALLFARFFVGAGPSRLDGSRCLKSTFFDEQNYQMKLTMNTPYQKERKIN